MDTEEKKTVLVVDDEPDIRLFLKTVLEDAGFNVMTADNGKHALERLSEQQPDLISLDLVMPKMRGITLLKYLQKNPAWKDIPYIVVTAHARDELGKEDYLKLKADKLLDSAHSFIEKPVKPADYIKSINEILGLSEKPASEIEDLRQKIKEKIRGAKKEQLEETLRLLDR